jgi:hypothetical protein
MVSKETDEETLRMHNGPTKGPLSAAREFVSALTSEEDAED